MRIRNAMIVLLGGAVISVALWQQQQLKRLRMESAVLREQLNQASLKVGMEPTAPAFSNAADRPSESSSSAEVLRLRGEVGVLRRQLAEVSQSLKSVQSDMQAKVMKLTAAEADLKAREQMAEEARQKVSALTAAMNLPPNISEKDAEAVLSPADLLSFRRALRDAEEAERFAQLAKLKLAMAHAEPGAAGPAAEAQ